jgi:hypothetical protein
MWSVAARCCSMWPLAERTRVRDEIGQGIHPGQVADVTKTIRKRGS